MAMQMVCVCMCVRGREGCGCDHMVCVCASLFWDDCLQRDLCGGVSLQAVSEAAGVTEDLQLERFFSILQYSMCTHVAAVFICLLM